MKYKVIKKRPGSPDVGTECELKKWHIQRKYPNFMPCVIKLDGFDIEEYFEEVKELPKTWQDIGKIENAYHIDSVHEIHRIGNIWAIEGNEDTRPTKELAEGTIALAQLMQLRDVYRDGWKPNFDTKQEQHIIVGGFGIPSLSFPTAELCDQFQENFKDLIEQAKPLFYS